MKVFASLRLYLPVIKMLSTFAVIILVADRVRNDSWGAITRTSESFGFNLLHVMIGVAVGILLWAWQYYVFKPITENYFKRTVAEEKASSEGIYEPIQAKSKISCTIHHTVVGFVEEVFFRGILLNSFGAIASVVFFVYLHGSATTAGFWLRALISFICALALTMLVLWTGSLWPAIVAHAIHNMLVENICEMPLR